MQRDLSLGSRGKKDVLLYPRADNLLPGRLQEEALIAPCCPLGLRLLSLGVKKSFYECYSRRCGFPL